MPFAIELSTEISHRVDFALICNARDYVDAVEVGTDIGMFARSFLDRWRGHWLICVDPYTDYAERPYDRTIDAMIAVQALMPHYGRFRFVRDRSPDAIGAVMQMIKAPEFCYIDGSHLHDDVLNDIEAWWEVLAPGGLIAGHDFDETHPGVMEAVTDFAMERDLVVRLTHEEQMPSWYVYRQEPETLIQRLFSEGSAENPHYVALSDGPGT